MGREEGATAATFISCAPRSLALPSHTPVACATRLVPLFKSTCRRRVQLARHAVAATAGRGVGKGCAGGDGVEVGVLAENYLCYVGRTLALLVK